MRVAAKSGEATLRLLFSAFPGGLPGMSLLLLRAVLASSLLVEGGFYLGAPAASFTTSSVGLAALVTGALLFVGCLTPVAGLVAILGAAGVALSLFPQSSPSVFDSKAAVILGLTMLLTIIGTGPGRFSVDARMFGRREIVIPPSKPGPERKYGLARS